MNLRLIISGILISLCISPSFGQGPGCPNVDLGPDDTLSCSIPCDTLITSMLKTGESTSYAVTPIPYLPPFLFTGGSPLFIGIDDIWSGVINIPFNFCFYGNAYNQMIVGANGLISFDISLAGGYCEWQFGASIPTPGPPPGGIYNNSINGAFHDMDPSIPQGGNDINFAVFGAPPCRTFVVNWYDVPHFQCNNLFTTQQIVFYETTNVIEVYIEDKPTCFTWNSGNAVIGLQDATGANGITPPGRNTGSWSASNEAWRFTPDGLPNFLVTWYEGLNIVGNGDSLVVCPLTATDYIAEVVYTNCDLSVVTVYDTITVFSTGGGYSLNDTLTNATCFSTLDGSASVSPTGGAPPFTYLWDVTTGSQTTSTATGLGPGTYSVTVTDSSGCMSMAIITVGSPPALLSMIADTTMETCTNSSDGSIIISTSGGTPFYSYIWSNGGTDSTATGLDPGIYYVTITDANGCDTVITVEILTASPYIINVSEDDTICPGTSYFLSASGGTIYEWSNGATTPDITVIPESTTTYTVTVSDGLCTTDGSVTVIVDPDLGPVPDFEADPLPAAKVYEIVNFTDLSSFVLGTIISWDWDFGDGHSSTEQNPKHSYPMPGNYTVILIVTGDNGCTSTDSLDYIITSDPIIAPNVFTPNGDSQNDFLIFTNLEYYGASSLVIFNRWGNKVYESGNYQNDWDGGDVVNGVYYFILGVPEMELITGYLMVLGKE